jgi:hypothetical protein
MRQKRMACPHRSFFPSDLNGRLARHVDHEIGSNTYRKWGWTSLGHATQVFVSVPGAFFWEGLADCHVG